MGVGIQGREPSVCTACLDCPGKSVSSPKWSAAMCTAWSMRQCCAMQAGSCTILGMAKFFRQISAAGLPPSKPSCSCPPAHGHIGASLTDHLFTCIHGRSRSPLEKASDLQQWCLPLRPSSSSSPQRHRSPSPSPSPTMRRRRSTATRPGASWGRRTGGSCARSTGCVARGCGSRPSTSSPSEPSPPQTSTPSTTPTPPPTAPSSTTMTFEPGKVGTLTVHDKVYNFKKAQWHTPSEHTINGERYPLELHLVHGNDDGSIAIIAILYKYGNPDSFHFQLRRELTEMTTDKCNYGEENSQVEMGLVHMHSLQKRTGSYFQYGGSLTTPPCTEGVIWNVLSKVRHISKEQVGLLTAVLPAGNARPVRPINGRPVQFYHALNGTTSSTM